MMCWNGFAATELTPGEYYVAFPAPRTIDLYNEIEQWLTERLNTPVRWGIFNSNKVGVFLVPEDFVAFRLRFS